MQPISRVDNNPIRAVKGHRADVQLYLSPEAICNGCDQARRIRVKNSKRVAYMDRHTGGAAQVVEHLTDKLIQFTFIDVHASLLLPPPTLC
jgi:hypothetical protein